MKRYLWMIAVLVTLSLGLTTPLAAAPLPQEGGPLRLITVSGEAEVRVVPDEVVISVGVDTRHANLRTAKRLNDDVVKKLIAIAQGYGVEQRYIQTDYIYIDQNYYYSSVRDEYIVRRAMMITLHDLTQFEELLTDLVNAGANEVRGIEFRTTELRTYRDQARALAIQAAYEKAVDLTGALGQEIGVPHNIHEDVNNWWSGYSSWWYRRSSGSMTQNVIQEIPVGDLGLDGNAVAPGMISIKANITVTFEMVTPAAKSGRN